MGDSSIYSMREFNRINGVARCLIVLGAKIFSKRINKIETTLVYKEKILDGNESYNVFPKKSIQKSQSTTCFQRKSHSQRLVFREILSGTSTLWTKSFINRINKWKQLSKLKQEMKLEYRNRRNKMILLNQCEQNFLWNGTSFESQENQYNSNIVNYVIFSPPSFGGFFD